MLEQEFIALDAIVRLQDPLRAALLEAVERIVKSLPAGDYKMSLLISEIVKSDAFRQRRGVSQ